LKDTGVECKKSFIKRRQLGKAANSREGPVRESSPATGNLNPKGKEFLENRPGSSFGRGFTYGNSPA